MSTEIVMPQLSLSMDSGQIVSWLKESGDRVKAGEILFEVESDKATIEVEAVADGILHIGLGPENGEILVGEVVGYLLGEGEEAPLRRSKEEKSDASSKSDRVSAVSPVTQSASTQTGAAQPDENSEFISPFPARYRRTPSTPAARRLGSELGIDWRLAKPTGADGQIKLRDVEALRTTIAVEKPTISISPVARAFADSIGLGIQEIADQFPGVRLERQHIEAYIRDALGRLKATVPTVTSEQRQPLTSVRRITAQRMHESHITTAPVTLTTQADAYELVRIRESFKAAKSADTAPSYSAIFAKLCAHALQKHSQVNASLEDNYIVFHQGIHVGTAVDTERGLVVPVIRDVQAKSLLEVTNEMAELFQSVQLGKAKPEQLTGGTFTVTNLGQQDIDHFTPIINQPQGAILGVGRIVEQVVARDGEMMIRPMVALSLTFDHRLVDGAPAARFLYDIKQNVEKPYLWMA